MARGVQVQEMVAEQTKEWSAMVSQQLQEEHQLLKSNIQQQNELLSKLMKDYQETQMKDLESRHDRCVRCCWYYLVSN